MFSLENNMHTFSSFLWFVLLEIVVPLAFIICFTSAVAGFVVAIYNLVKHNPNKS